MRLRPRTIPSTTQPLEEANLQLLHNPGAWMAEGCSKGTTERKRKLSERQRAIRKQRKRAEERAQSCLVIVINVCECISR